MYFKSLAKRLSSYKLVLTYYWWCWGVAGPHPETIPTPTKKREKESSGFSLEPPLALLCSCICERRAPTCALAAPSPVYIVGWNAQ